jgi:actin-related protein 5
LPAEQNIQVRRAKDCTLDAWRGAAAWAGKKESRERFVTRGEWAEKGGEYIKEHGLGNAS